MSTLASAPKSRHESEEEKTEGAGYARVPGRRHFWIRRVHSLMGLMFGGYIAVHLIVNATGLWPRDYQMNVDKIHSMEPMLWLIEITAIFIPLLLHALYGIYITWAGVKFNTTKYAYGGNIRYTLQRWTAMFLLAFLAFHIGTLHRWGLAGVHDVIEKIHPTPSGIVPGSMDVITKFSWWCASFGLFNGHNQAFQSTVSGVHYMWDSDRPWAIGNVLFMLFYLLGIWSATFHFANGLWTSAIAWGLTITAKSQRRWGHVCLGFGIVLTLIGTIAWCAFTVVPAANGDTNRWNEATHTLPDEDATHEQDQGIVTQKQEEKKDQATTSPAANP